MPVTPTQEYLLARCETVKADRCGRKVYWLRPGDLLPDWPVSYRCVEKKRKYVRLVWRVASKRYVATREHRLVAGMPDADVHHLNGNKEDNRSGNLESLDKVEHARLHSGCEWDLDEALELYRSGQSIAQLSMRYNVSRQNVHLRLSRRGVRMRDRSAAAKLSFARGDRKRPTLRTHCKRGHEFTVDNTLYSAKQRSCRACMRLRSQGEA